MDPEFWHQRWEENNIGFQEREANPLLVDYFSKLSLTKGSRVFLPLCGKTMDIAWLLSNGYRVVGAELSDIAIAQLFTGMGVSPEISTSGKITHYRHKGLEIFGGDIFNLSGDVTGPVDAVYDRAALVALPRETRQRYTKHLIDLTDAAPQLLICYEYDQSRMDGPPFSVTHDEIVRHYRDHYEFAQLVSSNVPGGLKGKCMARENVWLLTKRPLDVLSDRLTPRT